MVDSFLQNARDTLREGWPGALILVLYVALMGVPGHRKIGAMEREKARIESPEAARSLKIVQNRYESIRKRLERMDQRERENAAAPTVVSELSKEQQRTVGRLLAEHMLILIEEGSVPGPKGAGLRFVRFHGAYGDVANFMDALASVNPPVITDSLEMEVPMTGTPAWMLRFKP